MIDRMVPRTEIPKEKPMARRGMLTIVSSIYDSPEFVAHFILKGKVLLQLLCQDEIGCERGYMIP